MTITKKNYSNKKAKVSIPTATSTTSEVNKNEPEIRIMLGKIISLVAGDGWLRVSDVLSIEYTCRAAKQEWCHNQAIWKTLVMIEWPNLLTMTTAATTITTTTTTTNAVHIASNEEFPPFGGKPIVLAGREVTDYRSVFLDQRLWLAAEAECVKAKEKWKEITHHDVECGRCGCNCTDGGCGGIPIDGDFRWEKKEEDYSVVNDRIFVPYPLGYRMSEGTMICIRRFCEPCFELLLDESILVRDDYERVKGKNLFDIVTKEMIEATTERAIDNRRTQNGHSRSTPHVYYTPFFNSGDEKSWQKMHNNVEADDIAIVVANALVQNGCRTHHLQLDGIHYNHPGFGPKGYKALALALSINTVVERIDFYADCGEGCGCDPKSYAEDKSNGFFLKAFQHNKKSALQELSLLCPQAFGPHTWEGWKKVKPYLKCGPLYYDGYNDYYDYVSDPDDDDEDFMESEEDNYSNDDNDNDNDNGNDNEDEDDDDKEESERKSV